MQSVSHVHVWQVEAVVCAVGRPEATYWRPIGAMGPIRQSLPDALRYMRDLRQTSMLTLRAYNAVTGQVILL